MCDDHLSAPFWRSLPQANAKWAQVVNPHNAALAQREKKVAELRSEVRCALPTSKRLHQRVRHVGVQL